MSKKKDATCSDDLTITTIVSRAELREELRHALDNCPNSEFQNWICQNAGRIADLVIKHIGELE